MDFEFTDLPKQKNFIGFESGIFCVFPLTDEKMFISRENEFGCDSNEWYQENYVQPGEPVPDYYDPRCRTWYQEIYN